MIGFSIRTNRLLTDSKRLGKWGQRRCEKFLRKKGLKKLASNYSCRAGEIDLIMVDKTGAIVFVEVKTRRDESYAAAEDAITKTKQQKIARTARYFLANYNIENRPYRFDAVTIVLSQNGRDRINHYQNAFLA